MRTLLKLVTTFMIIVLCSCSTNVTSTIKEQDLSLNKNEFIYTINARATIGDISPFIYGVNLKEGYSNTKNDYSTMVRLGGNRLTAYNWENNASNAGADWNNSSDSYMLTMVDGSSNEPGSVASTFIKNCFANNRTPLFTIPICYYVAADKDGIVDKTAKEDPSRWKINVPQKNATFSINPNLIDDYVYADECVNFITRMAGGRGKVYYCLDNEPDLWQSTHPLICIDHISCKDFVNRTIDYAKAIKDVDPEAKIFGFVSYGYSGFSSFSNASDWSEVKFQGNYDWFIDYYLDQIAKASRIYGKSLIDVLDVHWYPEAKGDNRVNQNWANTENDKAARLQAPRSLWDVTYKENSWITNLKKYKLPLLPYLKKSIDKYSPNMKIAITEFNYGGYDDITGAIALADVLGVFGKYDIFAACHWGNPGLYGNVAYKLYRDYDNNGSSFGSYRLDATINKSWVNTSIYASASDKDCKQIHLITTNKFKNDEIIGKFIIDSDNQYTKAVVYYVSKDSNKIQYSNNLIIDNNVMKYTIPAMSIAHIVLE